jgi:TPR repeat protein
MRAHFLYLAVLMLGWIGTAASSQDADLLVQANAGDPAAQTAMAFLYHEGDGVLQNYAQAAAWADKAAQQDVPEAQNLLGKYYHQGLGIEPDAKQALYWLERATKSGVPAHLYDFALVQEGTDPARAAQAYAIAAQAGHIDAAVSLGVLYQEGKGVDQDYARALGIYQQAADAGHPRAQNNLGLLYVRGTGVDQDYVRASALFASAAQGGLKQAFRNLGVMYENGFGVPLNETRAAQLYRQSGEAAQPEGVTSQTDPTLTGPVFIYDSRLAPLTQEILPRLTGMAQTGDPVAQFQLGWALTQQEAPTLPDFKLAAQMFKASGGGGHGPSMVNLAVLYFEGLGLPQDYMLGHAWFMLAAQAEAQNVKEMMARYQGRATPTQINQAQADAHTLLQRP